MIIKAAVDGRRIDLDVGEWGEPSDEADARLNRAAEDAKKGIDLIGPFTSVEDSMKDLWS